MKLSLKFLLLAALYGFCGMCMGVVMGAMENFTLMPVHAHLNLLGWVAISLYGISYEVFPAMGQSTLAKYQFYVVNLGVLLLIPALTLLLLGNKSVVPILLLGELCTLAALIMFMINIWQHRAN